MIIEFLISLVVFLGVIFIGVFLVMNILFVFMNLGYVWEEKHPNKKGLFDILDDFWKWFWRKIIN